MLYLRWLTLHLGQSLVVGHFLHHTPNLGAERVLDLPERRLGILDGVMQDRAEQRHAIGYVTDIGEDRSERNRVVDVRARVRIFPAL